MRVREDRVLRRDAQEGKEETRKQTGRRGSRDGMGGGTGEKNKWKASVPVGCAVLKGKAALCGPCFGGRREEVREVETGDSEISRAIKAIRI